MSAAHNFLSGVCPKPERVVSASGPPLPAHARRPAARPAAPDEAVVVALRIDDHGDRAVRSRTIRIDQVIDQVYVAGTSDHDVETYGWTA